MPAFFLILGFVFFLFHMYSFKKLKDALGLGNYSYIFFCFLAILFSSVPALVNLYQENGDFHLARFFFYGYIWLGFIFILTSTLLLCDFLNFFTRKISRFFPREGSFKKFSPQKKPTSRSLNSSDSKKTWFFIALAVSFVISIHGFFEAKDVRVEKIVIHSNKIPKRIKIVQISDLHIGLNTKEDFLRKIVNKINAVDPDLLISTGDLVDVFFDGINVFAGQLRAINPRLGKYAVTGNHEFYAGIDDSINFTKMAGFRVLREEGVTINNIISLVGMDDNAAGQGIKKEKARINALMKMLPENTYKILLRHRPAVADNTKEIFDLQLSGHTHGGQIFPFTIVTWFFYPVRTGLKKLSSSNFIYVSKGTGTWGPPMRFLARPEITLIELVPVKKQ